MSQPDKDAVPPLISVIVPVYNGAEFLAEAVQSVLDQDYRPLDLLVVDDGSTDPSAAIASGFPDVRVLHKAHSGLAATLNCGVRHATGELLAFLDADDRWLPGKLTRQMAELRNRPDLDMVFTHTRQFTRVAGTDGLQDTSRETFSLPQAAVSKIALLIWRSSFAKVGAFSEDQQHHDFLEWYLRATGAGLRMATVPEVLVERRIHGQNFGRQDLADKQEKFLRTLRAGLNQRRRAAPQAGSSG